MIPWADYDGYREVVAFPATYDASRFSLAELRAASETAMVMFRGWPFIAVLPPSKIGDGTLVAGDGLQTVIERNRMGGHDHFETWTLKRSGLFFHKSLMDEETYDRALSRGRMLNYTATIYHVSEAIGSLWRLYEALSVPDGEQIVIRVLYTGMLDRRLDDWERSFQAFPDTHVCRSEEVQIERSMSLGLWRASDAQVATDICIDIFQQLQAFDVSIARVADKSAQFLSEIRF